MRDKQNPSRENQENFKRAPNRLDQASASERDQAYRRPEARQGQEKRARGSEAARMEPKRLDEALRDQRRPRATPQETQWSQLEAEERRRREAIRRAQAGRMTYPEQREQREQRDQRDQRGRRTEAEDERRFDENEAAGFEEESPRKKGSCLGYLIWFLVFIALGYFSLWFLIHGVSWLL